VDEIATVQQQLQLMIYKANERLAFTSLIGDVVVMDMV